MPIKHLVTIGAIALLALSASFPAHASGPSAAEKAQRRADMAALTNFKLTEAFFHKLQAYNKEVFKHPCKLSALSVFGDSNHKTFKQAVADYDARPGVHAALERSGLTARRFLIGAETLLMAGFQEAAKEHPELISSSGEFSVSPENMAFFKKHKGQIQRQSRKLYHEELRRHGGRLPACLTKSE